LLRQAGMKAMSISSEKGLGSIGKRDVFYGGRFMALFRGKKRYSEEIRSVYRRGDGKGILGREIGAFGGGNYKHAHSQGEEDKTRIIRT